MPAESLDASCIQPPATMWSQPAAKEEHSASVVVASLELDIRLVEDAIGAVLGTLKRGEESPEGRGYLRRQLEELAAEKARYKEKMLALLAKCEPRQPSHKRSLSVPRRLGSLANVAAPEGAAVAEPAAPGSGPEAAPATSALGKDDQKAVERASVNWMETVTLGTEDAPRKAADLYAADGVLLGTEVYAPNDPLWGSGSEVARNTPDLIYAYYDTFARLPDLRVVQCTPGPVRVHGDFASQGGFHTFAWRGPGGSTEEMRARYSFVFRRDGDSRGGGAGGGCNGGGGGTGDDAWVIVEHCSFTMTAPAGTSTVEVLERNEASEVSKAGTMPFLRRPSSTSSVLSTRPPSPSSSSSSMSSDVDALHNNNHHNNNDTSTGTTGAITDILRADERASRAKQIADLQEHTDQLASLLRRAESTKALAVERAARQAAGRAAERAKLARLAKRAQRRHSAELERRAETAEGRAAAAETLAAGKDDQLAELRFRADKAKDLAAELTVLLAVERARRAEAGIEHRQAEQQRQAGERRRAGKDSVNPSSAARSAEGAKKGQGTAEPMESGPM